MQRADSGLTLIARGRGSYKLVIDDPASNTTETMLSGPIYPHAKAPFPMVFTEFAMTTCVTASRASGHAERNPASIVSVPPGTVSSVPLMVPHMLGVLQKDTVFPAAYPQSVPGQHPRS